MARPRTVLALDTSTPDASVCVASDGEVLSAIRLGQQGTHASTLIPAIEEALGEAGVEREGLEALLVGAGPGSFTGVRVAAATAKGLAHVLDVPVYPFSSLAVSAAAVDAHPDVGRLLTSAQRVEARYVLFDARSDRVYAACYLPTADGYDELVAPHATTIGELLSSDLPMCWFAGDGAKRHADEIRGAGFEVPSDGWIRPWAEGLVRLYETTPDAEPLADPGAWEPDYLRDTGAVRMRKAQRAE